VPPRQRFSVAQSLPRPLVLRGSGMRHGRARAALSVMPASAMVPASSAYLAAIIPRVSSTRVPPARCGSLGRLRASRANSTRDPASEAARNSGLTQLTRVPNRLTASLVGSAILSEPAARRSESIAGEPSARRGFSPSAPTQQPVSIGALSSPGPSPLAEACGRTAPGIALAPPSNV
jgi:hypothetical protein